MYDHVCSLLARFCGAMFTWMSHSNVVMHTNA
jgi:hypothetical protein